MSIADLSLDISPPAYGLLRLDEHRNLACVICVVREEGERCSDWLDVCVPTGALEQLFHVEYPLVREGNRWLHELDVTFLGLADRVHAATAFDLAFVGEEVSGYSDVRPTWCRRV